MKMMTILTLLLLVSCTPHLYVSVQADGSWKADIEGSPFQDLAGASYVARVSPDGTKELEIRINQELRPAEESAFRFTSTEMLQILWGGTAVGTAAAGYPLPAAGAAVAYLLETIGKWQ